jgi:tetratricopeptide (TPR) repeat protein
VILRAAPGDHRRELARALRVSVYGAPADVAIPRMEEALRLSIELHGEVHTTIAESLNDLALALEPIDPLRADTLMERAVRIELRLLGDRHSTTLSLMNNLAGLRRDRGDFAGAEPVYRRVLETRREVYPDDSFSIARTQYGLGIALTELGEAEEAEVHLREARVLHAADLGSDHVVVHLIDIAIARCLAVQGRFEEAEILFLETYPDVMAAALPPLDKAKTLERAVKLYEDWGRADEAARFRDALEGFTDSTGVRLSVEPSG